MEEIWKSAVGYNGYYEVSNLGRVKRLSRSIVRSDGKIKTFKEKICKQHERNGYMRVSICFNYKNKFINVHIMVAESFLKNKNNLPIINHKDGIKNNNKVINLEWSSYGHNRKHAAYYGLNNGPYGERSSTAKLTNELVNIIRTEYIETKLSHRKLANKYNVSKSTITALLTHRTWKYA